MKKNKIIKIVKKAAKDSNFRDRLIKNPKKVLEEEGITISDNISLKVVENTEKVCNIVVPDQPISEKNVPESLNENSSFKQVVAYLISHVQKNDDIGKKLRVHPNETLKKMGVTLKVEFRVYENDATRRFLAVPRQKDMELSEEDLLMITAGANTQETFMLRYEFEDQQLNEFIKENLAQPTLRNNLSQYEQK